MDVKKTQNFIPTDFKFFDVGLRNHSGKKLKAKALKKVQKRLEICMPVAGVPRDVGLSTHGLRAGS
jgi:hypothetical protein